MSGELVLVVVVLSLLAVAALSAAYLTAHRLDRLHIRTDLARAALVGALGRRQSMAVALARALARDEHAAAERLTDAVALARRHPTDRVTGADPAPEPDMRRWTVPGDDDRKAAAEHAENDLGMALSTVDSSALPAELIAELEDVTDRVAMARRFYNDAVRDTRSVREKRVVRALRLAGRAPMPDYVELVDPPPHGA